MSLSNRSRRLPSDALNLDGALGKAVKTFGRRGFRYGKALALRFEMEALNNVVGRIWQLAGGGYEGASFTCKTKVA